MTWKLKRQLMIRVILLKTEGKYSMEGNKVQKKSMMVGSKLSSVEKTAIFEGT